MLYATLYAISKVLNVITTSKMDKRALQLGGKHWHNIFCLSGEENLTPHRRSELEIVKMKNKPVQLDFVRCLNVISGDEFRQHLAEYMAKYDILLRHVRKNNVYMGGVLIFGTLDHMQIQPANNQRPFLT